MSDTSNFYHFTIWNMNGGPVPTDAVKALSEALEGVLKDTEEKHGTRLLLAVNEDAKAF